MIKADYGIHEGWGDHIKWLNVNWETVNFNTDTLRVYGHMPQHPKIGETLLCEMENSFMKFMFTKVDACSNPPDMFFADVKACEQEKK